MVPALDFDPDKDAARIETAIKTKGKPLPPGLTSLDVALLPADEQLVFVSQRLGSGCLGRAGKASNVCVGKAELWPLTGSYWQQSDH